MNFRSLCASFREFCFCVYILHLLEEFCFCVYILHLLEEFCFYVYILQFEVKPCICVYILHLNTNPANECISCIYKMQDPSCQGPSFGHLVFIPYHQHFWHMENRIFENIWLAGYLEKTPNVIIYLIHKSWFALSLWKCVIMAYLNLLKSRISVKKRIWRFYYNTRDFSQLKLLKSRISVRKRNLRVYYKMRDYWHI